MSNRLWWWRVGGLALAGLAVAGSAAQASEQLLPVWKRSDGEARIRLATPEALPRDRVAVAYELVAVNTAQPTPEMVVARFGVVCARKSGQPLRLMHAHTTMYKLMGDRVVRDSDEALSPPREVSLESHDDFAAMPAGVACRHALARLTRRE